MDKSPEGSFHKDFEINDSNRYVYQDKVIQYIISQVQFSECDLSLFTEEELAEPYKGARRILKTYSERESLKMIDEIMKHLGSSGNPYYKVEKIYDGFGNILGYNGTKIYDSTKWNYHGEKSTTLGYLCSWSTNGTTESKCIKWCSLLDTTTYPGD